MKQLAYYHLDDLLMLDGYTQYCLVIMNPREFYKTIELLNQQQSSEEEGFVLSESETSKKLSLKDHSDILIDYFNMDFNDRKIKNMLYEKVAYEVINTDLSLIFQKMQNSITELMEGIVKETDVMTTFDNKMTDINDILKITDLKILEQYNDPLEMITNYIDIIFKLKHIDLLFLVNIRQILTLEEIKKLFKQCEYMKLNLVTIESQMPKEKGENEKIILIDEDLCEIRI